MRAAPDGTIVGVRILHSSGNPAWDDAVVRALHKTDTLPRDTDGRVPPSLVIGFRPSIEARRGAAPTPAQLSKT